MTVDLDVLVLPAFDDLEGVPGEASAWNRVYDFEETIEIGGVPNPLRYTPDGLGIVPTGIGKPAAATTTTALLTSDRLDLSDCLFMTVGVAGAPPSIPVGSVVISEAIVDWDDKCRLDEADEVPLAMNPYTEGQGWYELDQELVERTRSLASDVELDPPEADDAPEPELLTGTNLAGDELWHGESMATQAEWLVSQYGCDQYHVTEMEDAATAFALDRFDRLEDYCNIRGVSNHDRPLGGETARESFFSDEFESGYGTGIDNAVLVAKTLVDDQLG